VRVPSRLAADGRKTPPAPAGGQNL